MPPEISKDSLIYIFEVLFYSIPHIQFPIMIVLTLRKFNPFINLCFKLFKRHSSLVNSIHKETLTFDESMLKCL